MSARHYRFRRSRKSLNSDRGPGGQPGTSRHPLRTGDVTGRQVARQPLCKSGRWVSCEVTIERSEGAVGPSTPKQARSVNEIPPDGREKDARCKLLVERANWVCDDAPHSGSRLWFLRGMPENTSYPASWNPRPGRAGENVSARNLLGSRLPADITQATRISCRAASRCQALFFVSGGFARALRCQVLIDGARKLDARLAWRVGRLDVRENRLRR